MENSLYIKLKDGKVHKTFQDKAETSIFYDLDIKGKCLGIEIINFKEVQYDGHKIKLVKEK